MTKARIKIISNDGEVAIGKDIKNGTEMTFIRADVGAPKLAFLRDLHPGKILYGALVCEVGPRLARMRYRQQCEAAKKKNRKKKDGIQLISTSR